MGTRLGVGCCAWQSAWLVAVLVGALMVSSASGAFTLEDRNSSASFEVEGDGQYGWLVDGVDQLYNQSFWWRVGLTGGEAPVSALGLVGAGVSDSNPFSDPRPDVLAALYREADDQFEIEVSYKLRGGLAGSRTADLAETIVIRNLTASPLDFHFFQYVDFDLDAGADGDTVWFLNDNTVMQASGAISVSETVVIPTATRRQVDFFANTVTSLLDDEPTDLNNDMGPLGPGDVTWAFQWDFVLVPHGSLIISKDKLITPEPTTLALLGCGLFAGLLRRRR